MLGLLGFTAVALTGWFWPALVISARGRRPRRAAEASTLRFIVPSPRSTSSAPFGLA